VSIHVVEDLAKHVCAVEGLIRDDTNRCGCLTGQGLAGQALDSLRAVREQAFANTGADCEQQDDRAMIGAAEAQVIPYELAGGRRGLRGYTIQARRSWDVAEARWIAIHNLYALHGCAYDVADRDGVRDQLPASDVEQRRRLSDRECSRDLQVERNVVVVDLVRAGYGGALQIEIQVVPSPRAARRHGGGRRGLRSPCFPGPEARERITPTGRHPARRR